MLYSLSPSRKALLLAPLAALVGLSAPAAAQYGMGTMGPVWHGGPGPGYQAARRQASADDENGKVDVARFVAPNLAPGTLAHGPITVASQGDAFADPQSSAPFEAAVVDQLLHAGYQTAVPSDTGGQVVELRVLTSEARPKEAPRKPVSGAMSVGVSNRGTMTGLALNVDLTKPKGAIIATRLEARIRDRASNKLLWEGRAEILTRQGDTRWGQQAIAGKLAETLFDGFPTRTSGS